MASPAQRAMYGNIYNDSLGAVGVWKAGMFHVLIAVAVILTVIRHTRAEEENGRAELLDSTAVGRYAGLTAALPLTFGASVVTGLIGFGGLLTVDVPTAGSSGVRAGTGRLRAGVQLPLPPSPHSCHRARAPHAGSRLPCWRPPSRCVPSATPVATGSSALSWLSPLGWSLQVRPYAGDRCGCLLLHLVTTAVLTGAAYALLARAMSAPG